MNDTSTLERLRRAYGASRAALREDIEQPDVQKFLAHLHEDLIARGEELDPAAFPALDNLSAAFFYRFLPIPDERQPPEFVYVPSTLHAGIQEGPELHQSVTVTSWNICWEAGQLRHELFADELPDGLRWLGGHTSDNIFLLPRPNRHRYFAYAVLFHLIPKQILARHGLPPLRRGLWPHYTEDYWRESLLPDKFDNRLSHAFTDLVWRRLDSGSGHSAFSPSEPIRLLAHNLDFWLPYAHEVVERRLRLMPRVRVESEEQARLLADGRAAAPAGVTVQRPRMGGLLWAGEEEAFAAVDELVDVADASGRLRGIIDSIRSSRVEEDFSDRWSFAKEDFERKLFRKRSKIKVNFVELSDTIPVHGPESEVHENILWEDFMGFLNRKEREITVLLRNGFTRVGDIASEMGYANHSPVSKALARIRSKALDFLD